jgi:hypothetical protein
MKSVLHYSKDGVRTGPDREHAETSVLALRLVDVNTLPLDRVLAEPACAKTPS